LFYEWFLSEVESQDLRRFVLRFFPSLVWIYLSSPEEELKIGIQNILVAIYNVEYNNRSGLPLQWSPASASVPTYYQVSRMAPLKERRKTIT
jgi:hypothetical protein